MPERLGTRQQIVVHFYITHFFARYFLYGKMPVMKRNDVYDFSVQTVIFKNFEVFSTDNRFTAVGVGLDEPAQLFF